MFIEKNRYRIELEISDIAQHYFTPYMKLQETPLSYLFISVEEPPKDSGTSGSTLFKIGKIDIHTFT